MVGNNPGGQYDVHVLPFGEDNTRTEELIATGFAQFNSQVSPNGCWIAYQSNESGQFEVYVRPFPNMDEGRWRISRDGGQSPVWSADWRELFFRRTGSNEMLVVAVESEPTFRAWNPEALFEAPYLSTAPGGGRTRSWFPSVLSP